MAQFKNVTGDTRFVHYGFPAIQIVEPGGTLTVPDEFAPAYDQPGIWEPETPSKPSKPNAPSAEQE